MSDLLVSPSALYGPGARSLQDELDTRRLADRLAGHTVHAELTDAEIELIGEQATVWIGTVDNDGWPDVSYKGGDPGFVSVVSRRELRIPSYDGNGMMRTLGNIVDTGRVGLLFVDPSRPRRIRIHGTATVSTEPASLAGHHGAQAVVIVLIARVFPNCGRYVHQESISEFVPRIGSEPPMPEWKQRAMFEDVLPESDRRRLT